MSLSRIEAQKIFPFEYNKDAEKDWTYYIPIGDFMKLLEIWRKNPPSKEILGDLKECINYKHEEYDTVSQTIIKGAEVLSDKKKFIENIIHFGASKMNMIVATQGTKFSVFIEEYVKNWIGMPSFLAAGRYFLPIRL